MTYEVGYNYTPCGNCGKLNKSRKGARLKHYCPRSPCRKVYLKWMYKRRRLIFDAYTECPICGTGIGQVKALSAYDMRLCCCPSCSAKAINAGIKAVPWDKGQPRPEQTRYSKVTCRQGEMRRLQAVQCQQLYSTKRPCVHYEGCLDKEVAKQGSGFMGDCQRFKEQRIEKADYRSYGRPGFTKAVLIGRH